MDLLDSQHADELATLLALSDAGAPPVPVDSALTPTSAWTQVLESQGTADGW
mgnify:CR=1 FL=1